MKVLHVYRTCYPETKGGVEQVIRFIASGTKPLGIETKILTLSDNQTSSYYCEGTEIISVKKSIEISSNGFSWKLIRQFKKLSKWADIIHYHYPWPTGDFLFIWLIESKYCNVSFRYYSSKVLKEIISTT